MDSHDPASRRECADASLGTPKTSAIGDIPVYRHHPLVPDRLVALGPTLRAPPLKE
ncbi:hypothetical protein [Lysobacter antibioticus]|uniref:hypothetical protein n=1 Tax=Lysobacter TaxID=68 RepID=UPI0013774784|nr:hypothetical protein [Lysobacter antibioticus]